MHNGTVKKNWTIMVYMSADDVLANFAIDSLNQFRNAATSVGDKVVALLDPNDGTDKAYEYRFEFTADGLLTIDGETITRDKIKEVTLRPAFGRQIAGKNMADPNTLAKFLKSASEHDDPKDRHYCLILWGHGTELLLDQDPGIKGARYLTPAKLEEALKAAESNGANKPDIIAFDACSMSMIELASALKGHARFMIASQGEVPDVSFPYQRIMESLRGHGKKADVVSKSIPAIYVQSFQDYFVADRSGVQEIMLSSLDLDNTDQLTEPINTLTSCLLPSVDDEHLCRAIVSARADSIDFVLGLFVDLRDFCDKLANNVKTLVRSISDTQEVREAKTACYNSIVGECDKIVKAIDNKQCVIANVTRENKKVGYGVSIYFPYSKESNEGAQTKRLLGQGETGIINLGLVKGGSIISRKARDARMEELEDDFGKLPFFTKENGWGDFILQAWSLVLASSGESVDLHYSARRWTQSLSNKVNQLNARVISLIEENKEAKKKLAMLQKPA